MTNFVSFFAFVRSFVPSRTRQLRGDSTGNSIEIESLHDSVINYHLCRVSMASEWVITIANFAAYTELRSSRSYTKEQWTRTYTVRRQFSISHSFRTARFIASLVVLLSFPLTYERRVASSSITHTFFLVWFSDYLRVSRFLYRERDTEICIEM